MCERGGKARETDSKTDVHTATEAEIGKERVCVPVLHRDETCST